MRLKRTLPPAAAPLDIAILAGGVIGAMNGTKAITVFEKSVKTHYGYDSCWALSSGKAALLITLQGLHDLYPEKSDVVIPAYTCFSVPSAIAQAGLRFRPCDIACDTLDYDMMQLGQILKNDKTLCVIPTDLYGIPANIAAIKAVIGTRGTFVIEDAAQAMGTRGKDNWLGTRADTVIFSFGRGKAFSTVEGGMVLTDNEKLARAIDARAARLGRTGLFGSARALAYAIALLMFARPYLYWLPNSIPALRLGKTEFDPLFDSSKLSPFQAGMGNKWHCVLEDLKRKRQEHMRLYLSRGIAPLVPNEETMSGLLRLPVLLPSKRFKQKLLQESAREGLGISGGYPRPVSTIFDSSNCCYGTCFPGATEVSERLVTLPIHPYVTVKDINKICDVIDINRSGELNGKRHNTNI